MPLLQSYLFQASSTLNYIVEAKCNGDTSISGYNMSGKFISTFHSLAKFHQRILITLNIVGIEHQKGLPNELSEGKTFLHFWLTLRLQQPLPDVMDSLPLLLSLLPQGPPKPVHPLLHVHNQDMHLGGDVHLVKGVEVEEVIPEVVEPLPPVYR